jgi:hypothetical protein
MKIQHAHTLIESLLAKAVTKAERKPYEELLGAIRNLQERDMSVDQAQSLESALERLGPDQLHGLPTKELKRRKIQFMKAAREIFSLLPEDHYMGIGLCLGVAFGGLIGSLMQGFAGMPEGTSATGVGVGLGLVAGMIIARHLDVEAIRQNRVLITRAHSDPR